MLPEGGFHRGLGPPRPASAELASVEERWASLSDDFGMDFISKSSDARSDDFDMYFIPKSSEAVCLMILVWISYQNHQRPSV